MPPKPKFTREEIVQTALEIVSQKGAEALTAKELGDALGSSARPIFTVFNSMKEVQDEVRAAAMHRFESFAEQKLPGTPLFKQVGMQMVLFARVSRSCTSSSLCRRTAARSALTTCSASLAPRPGPALASSARNMI